MRKIYLCNDITQAKLLRKLIKIRSACILLKNDYRLPNLTNELRLNADSIYNYCNKNIATQLKNCELFDISTEQDDNERTKAYEKSIPLSQYLGSCCVLAGDEAEIVINELKRIDMCAKIQKALATGRSVLID